MQSPKYYGTVFHLKKEFTKSSSVLYFGFILVIGSLLQISSTDFFGNNDHILMKIPSIYAQDNGGNDNGGGDGNGGGDDGNDGDGDSNEGDVSDDNADSNDVEALSLEEDTEEEEEVGQEDTPEELTLSEDGVSEVLTLKQEDKDADEVLTLEDGEDETQPPTTEPPTTEPPTTEPPTTEPPTTEPPTTEPPKVENDTSVQQAEQKAPPQVLSGVADKDVEDMEDYLDKTRDERVDRNICGRYNGVWNYDTNQCEIDDPDRKKEYEKDRKEKSRFDQIVCPRYGGEWNDKEKKCEIEDLEERTAYEDYLCDDSADTILYDVCNRERYEGNTQEQIKDYDKNQCIYSFDGEWNEDTLSCETENADYQKYLDKRHDIYSCITSGKEWNDQKNICETKHPRDHDGDRDHDRTIIKKYYREDYDDDYDIADLDAYNMGYRDGRFDKLNNMPYSDMAPFYDDDAEFWYKIGYSVGWNSIVGESSLIIK